MSSYLFITILCAKCLLSISPSCVFHYLQRKETLPIISGHHSLVRFPFGLKLDIGNKEMILIPNESDELYHCKNPRSDFLLENCFEVKNGRKLLIVEGCNIDRKVHSFEEIVLLGKYRRDRCSDCKSKTTCKLPFIKLNPFQAEFRKSFKPIPGAKCKTLSSLYTH
jgi:hypothetical protein